MAAVVVPYCDIFMCLIFWRAQFGNTCMHYVTVVKVHVAAWLHCRPTGLHAAGRKRPHENHLPVSENTHLSVFVFFVLTALLFHVLQFTLWCCWKACVWCWCNYSLICHLSHSGWIYQPLISKVNVTFLRVILIGSIRYRWNYKNVWFSASLTLYSGNDWKVVYDLLKDDVASDLQLSLKFILASQTPLPPSSIWKLQHIFMAHSFPWKIFSKVHGEFAKLCTYHQKMLKFYSLPYPPIH